MASFYYGRWIITFQIQTSMQKSLWVNGNPYDTGNPSVCPYASWKSEQYKWHRSTWDSCASWISCNHAIISSVPWPHEGNHVYYDRTGAFLHNNSRWSILSVLWNIHWQLQWQPLTNYGITSYNSYNLLHSFKSMHQTISDAKTTQRQYLKRKLTSSAQMISIYCLWWHTVASVLMAGVTEAS